MIYEYASENIIICKNFLPKVMLDKIKIDLLNNRTRFDLPLWSDRTKNLFSEKCGGLDYWIEDNKIPPNNEAIISLGNWFYHQGFFQFLHNEGRKNAFNFLLKDKKHKIHVISYNNDGYYNWHRDTEHFTFNLVLNDGDELEGGDMLFMDENRVVKIPNQNNLMVVMPTYIPHSITPLKSKSGKDVAFTQQRFSIQYWVKCN
jgi:hypothetical protein